MRIIIAKKNEGQDVDNVSFDYRDCFNILIFNCVDKIIIFGIFFITFVDGK